jgi:hypothetical protein
VHYDGGTSEEVRLLSLSLSHTDALCTLSHTLSHRRTLYSLSHSLTPTHSLLSHTLSHTNTLSIHTNTLSYQHTLDTHQHTLTPTHSLHTLTHPLTNTLSIHTNTLSMLVWQDEWIEHELEATRLRAPEPGATTPPLYVSSYYYICPRTRMHYDRCFEDAVGECSVGSSGELVRTWHTAICVLMTRCMCRIV